MGNLAYSEPPVTELIEGKTYLMSPRPRASHNVVVTNIAAIFRYYLRGKTCRPFSDGLDVHLDKKNVYVPDVMIVCDRSKVHRDGVYGAPDLVVEVLSPSTTKNDRGVKMRHYAQAGVKEYWIVSPQEKTVEVYYNQDGHFEINETYSIYYDWELRQMDEAERAAAKTAIPVSLYDDFSVSLEDVFRDVDAFQ